NGKEHQSGNFAVELAPESVKDIQLAIPAVGDDAEYFLNVFAHTKNAAPMVPAGHEVAREQFGGDVKYNFAYEGNNTGNLTVKKNNNFIEFSSGDITGKFNTTNGNWV